MAAAACCGVRLRGLSTVLHQFGASQAGDPLAPACVCPASLNASLTSRLIGRARMPGRQQNQWALWRQTDGWRKVSLPLLLSLYVKLLHGTHSHSLHRLDDLSGDAALLVWGLRLGLGTRKQDQMKNRGIGEMAEELLRHASLGCAF